MQQVTVQQLYVYPVKGCAGGPVQALDVTDQATSERPANNILKVLGTTRRKVENRFGTGLLFGNYMTVKKPGRLEIGDKLTLRPYEDQ